MAREDPLDAPTWVPPHAIDCHVLFPQIYWSWRLETPRSAGQHGSVLGSDECVPLLGPHTAEREKERASSLTDFSESESKVAQLCLTLCDPVDCSLPGSSIHGIFQARVLE